MEEIKIEEGDLVSSKERDMFLEAFGDTDIPVEFTAPDGEAGDFVIKAGGELVIPKDFLIRYGKDKCKLCYGRGVLVRNSAEEVCICTQQNFIKLLPTGVRLFVTGVKYSTPQDEKIAEVEEKVEV